MKYVSVKSSLNMKYRFSSSPMVNVKSSLISMLLEPLWGCIVIVGNKEIKIHIQRRFRSSLMVNVKSLWNPKGVYHLRFTKSYLIFVLP